MTAPRHVLFLQGPHGPFYQRLAAALVQAGCAVSRIGFNRGDRAEWGRAGPYHAYRGGMAEWAGWLDTYVSTAGVTEIVIYGDQRPQHVAARQVAQARGLTLHCFEEGYLRPHWITYERGGVNGHSRLMELSIAEMAAALGPGERPLAAVPDQWGTLWHHAFWGAVYHGWIALRNGAYPHFVPHRGVSVWQELSAHLRKALLHPVTGLGRRWAEARLRRSGAPYTLVLLQLGHDASVRMHSPFDGMRGFMDQMAAAFASGAPGHHHLVFKAHPFEDGRDALSAHARDLARAYGLDGRVHFIAGGKLGPLLDRARAAVTINSTAGQQALWRGLPLRAFGRAVYVKPELVSDQPATAFFANPKPPEHAAYLAYRQFLLETSQIKGSYYTRAGRANILREVIDRMLAAEDCYDRKRAGVQEPRAMTSHAAAFHVISKRKS
ncbi:capsular polysaccharide export protein [Rubricella aquisinus]|uniref:Capsular polysaccharide export protein n=1 Tax=Rubricella aquisinus TaxID=2028108 RepID=A0A840WVW1_9RHOB|nr:capsule biosynthesis protein CapA [Rubricella aquisinus]MBB5515330.1 capsular polysaccharide export protein [Rubricella aquisinus]